MTAATRNHIRRHRHMHALETAQAWVRAHGSPDCEHCGTVIEVQKPDKKFCSDRCQKAFNRRWHDRRTGHHGTGERSRMRTNHTKEAAA